MEIDKHHQRPHEDGDTAVAGSGNAQQDY